ncbi:MAG: HAMP domain-containing protein [Spartobacteria bacterium]|nr:HAMP domain-containing protein [Spartobacteria bacterium]
MMSMEEQAREHTGWATRRLATCGVLLALALSLFFLAGRDYQVTRAFDVPIAFTMVDDYLYVLEKEDNTILKLDCFGAGKTLTLVEACEIEPDDDRYYYMVRKLYAGAEGVVVNSYIYNRESRSFVGYRFREYVDFDEPPREIMRIVLEKPETYPEFFYTVDAAGDHYFLNNHIGQQSIWKLRRGAGAVVITGSALPAAIEPLGEKNDAFSSWGAIAVDSNGHMYVSSHSSGKVVEYAPQGRPLRTYGHVGFEQGELLAPNEVMVVSFSATNRQPLLTVASQGNRSWVQFDAGGNAVETFSPLSRQYPFPDVLVAQVYACGRCAAAYSFDMVNKAFLRLGPKIETWTRYRVRQPLRSLALTLAAALVLVGGARAWRRRTRRRYVFPLFLKLLVLFIPLLVISALLEGDWIGDVMKRELEEEYKRRSANLARAIVNSVSVDDLLKIQHPDDRESVAYENIYSTVSRIVDTHNVTNTPKWIIHKIRDNRYYFGISIWRGPIYEPYIVPTDRAMFFDVLHDKTPHYGRFVDEQGEWCSYLFPVTDTNHQVINVIELYQPSESIDRADEQVTRKVGQIIGITVLFFVPVILLFSLISTRPLHRLMLGIQRVSQGDFSHRIRVRSHDETAALAHAFNRMVVDLQRYTQDLADTTAEKERIETELRFARDMQQDNLPKRFPPFKGVENIDIYARMEPAREIGGDYYDFFMLDDRHIGVVIADVSGKGISAGLFMMVVRTLLRSNAVHNADPGQAITKMNRLLAEDNPTCMFATLFYFVCDLRSGAVRYCNAGHNPPVLLRNGKAELLPIHKGARQGIATGVVGTAEYCTQELCLSDGERIVLYTDGITEPVNHSEEMFGEGRLLEIIQEHNGETNQQICDRVYDAVNEFQNGLEQFDDMTMLFFKYNDFKIAGTDENLIQGS